MVRTVHGCEPLRALYGLEFFNTGDYPAERLSLNLQSFNQSVRIPRFRRVIYCTDGSINIVLIVLESLKNSLCLVGVNLHFHRLPNGRFVLFQHAVFDMFTQLPSDGIANAS